MKLVLAAIDAVLTDCRLSIIIDATGAASYHGFLPVVMRDCIQHMIGQFKFTVLLPLLLALVLVFHSYSRSC